MPVTAKTYECVALEDPSGGWELHDGYLVQKPAMTAWHNSLQSRLGMRLSRQLDEREYEVRVNSGKTKRTTRFYYIPDVLVVPRALVEQRQSEQPSELEVFDEPLPLVVEVWSPSTGEYDVESKLPVYQRRGDAEIWYFHPIKRTLVARRRQPDGSYTETLYTGGKVEPVALPGVVIDLETLFDQ